MYCMYMYILSCCTIRVGGLLSDFVCDDCEKFVALKAMQYLLKDLV